MEISKALQLSLLESLGIKYPRARVVNHPAEVLAAAEGLRFPLVVKANVGGSGAGIVRYEDPAEPRPRSSGARSTSASTARRWSRNVDEIVIDGQARPPLVTDRERWRE